ncbi:uncharacterized protein TNIN_463361 [Trichonephila inaurata madagascariensis]|uniref:Uncharacterized protein n=1 Tax=Trichonephila inaurata madagascariensis TaxID=2747483 RepID=A0A8X6Y6U0_9ARAC|nr:uncharacterized protein TNIN_463361 [Trichonephila inaurata madagascariensis]
MHAFACRDPIRCELIGPKDDARATRSMLMVSFVFILFGMVIPLLFPSTEQETLTLAYNSFAIAFVFFWTGLLRIILYYLLLKELETTKIPFDPAKYLSFANYLRILVFLSPESNSNSQTRVQKKDKAIKHDKQS